MVATGARVRRVRGFYITSHPNTIMVSAVLLRTGLDWVRHELVTGEGSVLSPAETGSSSWWGRGDLAQGLVADARTTGDLLVSVVLL